nr:maestro heat-like repeat-containing protein family member 7 [Podarcis muralis]
MLTSLLSEAPSLEALQDILVHTNGWIDSTEIFGRKRAVKSTSFLMKYVSEHFDFDISQDFPLLGQLVALLSLHLADNVEEIGLQSAEALYHLHCIMKAKMGEGGAGKGGVSCKPQGGRSAALQRLLQLPSSLSVGQAGCCWG